MSIKSKTLFALYVVLGLALPGLSQSPDNGFVKVQGDRFVLNGTTYKLKGTNYYPKNHMWADMWSSWDWSEIVLEAGMIRGLGMNSVRILVPYSYGGWGGPNPPAQRLQQLEDIVNLLGEKGIRSCITLFDWEITFPAEGTSRANDHISHLNAIVDRLKDNRYVLMWDVKNEPDHPSNLNGYDDWDYAPAAKAKIIDWLQRMCQEVRLRDPNHPVTVGLRWYNNVSDIQHFVDVAVFHSYWRLTIDSVQIPTVKACTSKPILVQEFGWPSNPTPCYRDGSWIYDYNETEQTNLYRDHLNAFIHHNTSGGMQWMTFDARNYTTDPYVSFENYFGLWKYDYSLKPAGAYYRDNFPVSLFPRVEDSIPPGPVKNLSVIPGDTSVRLSWTNPSDADFKGTMIRCKTTGYPVSAYDGTLVCSASGSPGAAAVFLHTGLTRGVTYYYALFAYDSAPNYSQGVFTAAVPASRTCLDAKQRPDDVWVLANDKTVSAIFSDCFYVQELDRSSGIRVEPVPAGLALGDVVNIRGRLASLKPDGATVSERLLASTTVTRTGGAVPPKPLTLPCRSVGGEAVPPLLPGVKDGSGLSNMGILVTILGRVTSKSGDCLWVDDGSHIADIPGITGVMVSCPSSSIPVSVGDFVEVTGIVSGSIPDGWDTNRRSVRLRSFGDLVKVQ